VGVNNYEIVCLCHCLGICKWIGLCKVVPGLWALGTKWKFSASSKCFVDNMTKAFEATVVKQVGKAYPSVRSYLFALNFWIECSFENVVQMCYQLSFPHI
jgi:hypothetical protein